MPKITFEEFQRRAKRGGLMTDADIASAWKKYQAGEKIPAAVAFQLNIPQSPSDNYDPDAITAKGKGAIQGNGKVVGKASKETPKVTPTSNTVGNSASTFAKGAGKVFDEVTAWGKKAADNVQRGVKRGLDANSRAEDRGVVASRRNKAASTMVDDLGLSDLLSTMGMYSQPAEMPGGFTYGDFSQQANDIAAKNFAPQYQALDMAAQGAQQQYNRADPIVAGLYEKLAGDIRNQAQATDARYNSQEAARAQQGQDLQANIANTYQGTQANQADLLAKLGIQDAAPTTLAPGANDSAWQQSQAAQNTQGQVDYLNSLGNASTDYQNNIANAEQTQGAVARQGLIAQLSQALSQVGQDRLGVASQQSQSATELASRLADRDYTARSDQFSAARQAQNDALDLAMNKYKLISDADQRDYSRAQDDSQMQLQVQQMAAETQQAQMQAQADLAKAQASGGIEFKDQGALTQAAARMQQYGSEGMAALNIAQQVAGGNQPKNRGDFIAQVVQAGQAQGMRNQLILLEAANQLADIMGYATTKDTSLSLG